MVLCFGRMAISMMVSVFQVFCWNLNDLNSIFKDFYYVISFLSIFVFFSAFQTIMQVQMPKY